MRTSIHPVQLFALSGLVLALSACTSLPKAPTTVLAEPNLPMEAPFEIVSEDKETVSTSTSPSIAATGWKEFYQDEKLKALIALGLENNKDLEQATLAIKKAQAQYQITRASDFPSVSSDASYSRGAAHRTDSNPTSGYSVGLAKASYELDLWGRIANLKEQALQSYLATAAARDTVQISLISNIAQAYVNLSYAKAQLYLAESTVASRERSLYITQKRFSAGIDSRSPSLQAESSLETAKLAVLTAKTNLLKAENALQYLIGAPIPSELMPATAVTGIINPQVFNTGMPSELLYYRPDIAQAEYQLKAAGANINVARAAFFPSISLSGSLGLSSSSLDELFKANALSWSFGPTVSLPIFDAGSRRATYEVAQIEQQQALANYEGVIQTAFKEVKDILAERATLNEQLASYYKLQDNYQRSYDIASATFRSGLSNYLDVLEAERSLFSAQQSILNMELQKVVSQISLYQVLGGGATLVAPQITNTESQAASMSAANIATTEQAQALQSERSPISAAQAVNIHQVSGVAPVTAPITDATPDELEVQPTTQADTSNPTEGQ